MKNSKRMAGLVAGSVLALASSAPAAVVAYYNFDAFNSDDTTLADNSGNGATLTKRGTPTAVAGIVGAGAASFDGTTGTPSDANPNDAFRRTGSLLIYPDAPNFSMSFWVDPTGATTGNISRTSEFNIIASGNLTVDFSGNSAYRLLAEGVFSASTPARHVTVTFADNDGVKDGSTYVGTGTLYVDGVQKATLANVVYTPGTASAIFALGDRNNANNTAPFKGVIDEFATYNQTLTAAQAVKLYDGSATPLTVPEPASIGLLSVAGLAALRRRRKSI